MVDKESLTEGTDCQPRTHIWYDKEGLRHTITYLHDPTANITPEELDGIISGKITVEIIKE